MGCKSKKFENGRFFYLEMRLEFRTIDLKDENEVIARLAANYCLLGVVKGLL